MRAWAVRVLAAGARSKLLKAALGLLLLWGLVCAAQWVWPAALLRDRVPLSHAFLDRDGQLLRVTLASDQQYRVWVPLAEVDPRLVDAVLWYEDRWYRHHPGVNPLSLARGAWSSYTGGVRRGASTLTMQLARRLYRLNTGTPMGKAQQVAIALWLELRHSKDELLEAYLNLAPYGGNIEGVGAASLVYFGKKAEALTLPEAFALAVIPQNPNRRGRRAAASAGAWPQALGEARARLWASMPEDWRRGHTPMASAAIEAEMRLPLHLRSVRELPFKAPHAVQTLSAELRPQAATRLSLDARMQRVLEHSVAQFVERRADQGVGNAAALLVDASTMEVKAWVGSADYFDNGISGQVNGTRAKRSSGSTLKPFIYGLGLDQGVLHPRTVLKDATTAFGTYSPENFDGQFEGPITAQDALVKSRNVPAVDVASRLTTPNLYQFLKRAGVRRMASESHYGLALALGGGEVSVEELARLYAMLANRGRLQPLRYEVGGPHLATSPDAPQLLSPEAAFITLDMLEATPRPDSGRRAYPPVAWKTGTSWGFRDAWTAGVFGRHVLVVWVGNFDGSANPAFVGLHAAAPLFFQIVDTLRSQGLDPGALVQAAPEKLAQVEVCAASGELPNAHCPRRVNTWFIPGTSPIKVSTLHREVWFDPSTGRQACGPGPGIQREVFEFWSSDMLQLFAKAGLPRRAPPPAARCDGGGAVAGAGLESDRPQIVSPLRGGTYVQRLSRPIPLGLRANAGRTGTLYWFANEAYVGESQTGQSLEWQPPAAGTYRLSAVDAAGRSDSRDLVVEFAP